MADFNFYADAVAAARVFALPSPTPSSTLPPAPPPAWTSSTSSDHPPNEESRLRDYPSSLSRTLDLTLFGLDVTTPHVIGRDDVTSGLQALVDHGSPLAQWVSIFLESTFRKIESLHHGPALLSLHDPICICTSNVSNFHPISSPFASGWRN